MLCYMPREHLLHAMGGNARQIVPYEAEKIRTLRSFLVINTNRAAHDAEKWLWDWSRGSGLSGKAGINFSFYFSWL